ncbi:uncharacterized protein LOC144359175 [Saccoglossus kowalevskii]
MSAKSLCWILLLFGAWIQLCSCEDCTTNDPFCVECTDRVYDSNNDTCAECNGTYFVYDGVCRHLCDNVNTTSTPGLIPIKQNSIEQPGEPGSLIYQPCLPRCPINYTHDEENNTCSAECHVECAGCYEPGADNCIKCKNYLDTTELICVAECGPDTYEDNRNYCIGCDESCQLGCHGAGPEGCITTSAPTTTAIFLTTLLTTNATTESPGEGINMYLLFVGVGVGVLLIIIIIIIICCCCCRRRESRDEEKDAEATDTLSGSNTNLVDEKTETFNPQDQEAEPDQLYGNVDEMGNLTNIPEDQTARRFIPTPLNEQHKWNNNTETEHPCSRGDKPTQIIDDRTYQAPEFVPEEGEMYEAPNPMEEEEYTPPQPYVAEEYVDLETPTMPKPAADDEEPLYQNVNVKYKNKIKPPVNVPRNKKRNIVLQNTQVSEHRNGDDLPTSPPPQPPQQETKTKFKKPVVGTNTLENIEMTKFKPKNNDIPRKWVNPPLETKKGLTEPENPPTPPVRITSELNPPPPIKKPVNLPKIDSSPPASPPPPPPVEKEETIHKKKPPGKLASPTWLTANENKSPVKKQPGKVGVHPLAQQLEEKPVRKPKPEVNIAHGKVKGTAKDLNIPVAALSPKQPPPPQQQKQPNVKGKKKVEPKPKPVMKKNQIKLTPAGLFTQKNKMHNPEPEEDDDMYHVPEDPTDDVYDDGMSSQNHQRKQLPPKPRAQYPVKQYMPDTIVEPGEEDYEVFDNREPAIPPRVSSVSPKNKNALQDWGENYEVMEEPPTRLPRKPLPPTKPSAPIEEEQETYEVTDGNQLWDDTYEEVSPMDKKPQNVGRKDVYHNLPNVGRGQSDMVYRNLPGSNAQTSHPEGGYVSMKYTGK